VNLTKHPDGYWVANENQPVSYPADGHDLCYSVEENSFWFRHRNAVITAAIQQFPPQGTIFDIGGGNGYVALGLREAGFPVVLVEPGLAGARHALHRGLEHVICSTVEAAGFLPQALPAVGLFDVLEHVENDRAFLCDLRSVMKTGGRLYVTVPAYQALWSLEDEYVGHYRRYSTKSLATCLEGAGFTIEYVTYFFWFLPILILLSRTFPVALALTGPSMRQAQRTLDRAVSWVPWSTWR
jgi:SAM-dependent methyltransferase